MVCSAASAQKNDLLHIDLKKEVLGKTIRVDVHFNNALSTNYTALQIDFCIPEGFDYVEHSLETSLRLLGHVVSAVPQQDNILRVTAFSAQNAEISGREGSIFTFLIAANEQAKRGRVYVKAPLPTFIKRDGTEHLLPQARAFTQFVPYAELKSYVLTYLVDGKEYKKMTLLEGETIPPVDNPVKEGHTFNGWRNLPTEMPSRNLTISGMFTVNTYTIVYYLNGKFYGRQQVKYGETIVPFEVTPGDKESFLGWENLPEKMPAKDLTIYGKTVVTGIENECATTAVDVYNLQGVKLLDQVTLQEAQQRLPKGIYIVNGQTLYIR